MCKKDAERVGGFHISRIEEYVLFEEVNIYGCFPNDVSFEITCESCGHTETHYRADEIFEGWRFV
jgi:hypothetical protein